MDKAYIVSNEQQEREELEKLEREGLKWIGGQYLPSSSSYVEFPYVLFKRNKICWGHLEDLSDEEIVFDGRKEEKMSEKYVVSQEFVNELKEWKDTLDSNDYEYKPLVGWVNLKNLPETVSMWWGDDEVPDGENNNRLIAILCWVNGEDVFEVEKPKKWVVRSKQTYVGNEYLYFTLVPVGSTNQMVAITDLNSATRFDTKEEAKSWANAHQEVVEVKE